MDYRHIPLAAALGLICFCPLCAQAGEISGTLRDENGKPMANAQLAIQDGRGVTAAKTASDATGHFDFHNVADGSYVVQAVDGDAILGSMTVSVAGPAPVEKDLTLTPDQSLNIVIAKRMQEARNNLSPHTGTNAYKIDDTAIAEMPQGDDTSFDKVLEQAPGVAEDSFGQVHVRGEHADLQYRLNGILLPEGISGFGQTLDPRIIESSTLLDGALPAQYGFRTAGVVDIQTKSGFQNGGTAEMYGGSYGTIEPSVDYGGTWGNADYFLSASHLSSDFGIEPPTSSANPIHDHTEQNKQFGYVSYMLDPYQRLELIAGNSIGYFQIPNNPGQPSNFCVGATCSFDSSQLDEKQFESNQFATVAWQAQKGDIDIQIAPYIRTSETHFEPDALGDLIFNGVASNVMYKDTAVGIQDDNSWRVNAAHTIRMGFQMQDEHIEADNTSQVFSTDPVLSTTPETIIDNHNLNGQLYGIYLQDEWKITDQLTMNYGARFDFWSSYLEESQISPRLGFVYKYDSDTVFHAGYAKYFTPPPLELVAPTSLSAFANTTNAPSTNLDSPVKPERTDSFDIGASHQLTPEIKLGLDAYYKYSHNLLDEGQFGSALVFTPFNYAHGRVYGTELTASYDTKDVKAYVNLAISRALGEDIVSAQFNFDDPAELAYIQNHWVHLDHDQTYTASWGVSYQVLEKTQLAMDSTVGSGLRQDFANTGTVAPYAVFDGSITQQLDLFPHDKTAIRFAVVNIFDTPYELRSGTGIGVGAPQYGMRRGFFAGISQDF